MDWIQCCQMECSSCWLPWGAWGAQPASGEDAGEGCSQVCPSQIIAFGLVSSLPRSDVCVCSLESAGGGGSSAPSLPARGSGGLCQHPAVPPTHRGAHIPRCPSHPCSSLPSAAVPGNLSLKSINFSHTPRERCKNPSSLPPWLLSATIWHGPPRLPPLPSARPAFDSSQTAGAL